MSRVVGAAGLVTRQAHARQRPMGWLANSSKLHGPTMGSRDSGDDWYPRQRTFAARLPIDRDQSESGAMPALHKAAEAMQREQFAPPDQLASITFQASRLPMLMAAK